MADDIFPCSITAYFIYQECFKKAGIINGNTFNKKEWPGILTEILIGYVKENIPFTTDRDYENYLKDKFGYPPENYHKYLRDRFNDISASLGRRDYLNPIGVLKRKFEPLLLYAGINNYQQINEWFRGNNLLPACLIRHVNYQDKGNELPLIDFDSLAPSWMEPVVVEASNSLETAIGAVLAGHSITGVAESFDPYLPAVPPGLKIDAVSVKKPFHWFSLLPIPDDGELRFFPDGGWEYNGAYRIVSETIAIKSVGLCAFPRDNANLWVKIMYLQGKKCETVYFAEPQPNKEQLILASPDRLFSLFNVLPNMQQTNL